MNVVKSDDFYDLFTACGTRNNRVKLTVVATSTQERESKVLAFDPGATTGIALIDEVGIILRTEAYSPSEVIEYAQRMATKRENFTNAAAIVVVIEKGPEWQQHSPITRSVEAKLKGIFPDAHLVTPNRWKGHPASKCAERLGTKHEKDAVKLARWFQSMRKSNAKNQARVVRQVPSGTQATLTVGTYSSRSRHKHH